MPNTHSTLMGLFSDIADAIRAKTGGTAQITADNFPSEIAAITGLDDELKTFNQHNTQLAAYLAATTGYTADNYSGVSVMGDYADASKNYDDPAGYALTLKAAGTIHFCDEMDERFSFSDTAAAGSYTVYNLIPNHVYRWYLVDGSGATVQNGKISSTGKVRQIRISGVDNCRDMGGWACDGGTVRYGVLYRGMDPAYWGSDGISAARDKLHIRSEVDLRPASEASRTASVLGGDVTYSLCPMNGDSLVSNLQSEPYKTAVKRALIELMESGASGTPSYFHCSLGADRTTVISYILHALLGVSQVDCDINYELTALAGTIYSSDVTSRKRTNYSYGKLLEEINGYNQGSLLKNACYLCARLGISAKLVNAYRRGMSSGTPADVSYNNTVTNTLTNVTNGNSAASVANGSSYTAVLSYTAGAVLMSIAVKMDSNDITEDVWDADTKTITIPEVTGDIVITATAAVNVASVTYDLTNVTGSNTVERVILGDSYSAVLTPNEYCDIQSVTVTMGGADITSAAYANGAINIASVTGNVVITAVAAARFTNLLTAAGYTNGKYLSGQAQYTLSDDASSFATGLMPIFLDADGNFLPIYIKGWTWDSSTHTRWYSYKEDGSGALTASRTYFVGNRNNQSVANDLFYHATVEVLDSAANYVKITFTDATAKTALVNGGFKKWALSMPGTGDGVIITLNEPIE